MRELFSVRPDRIVTCCTLLLTILIGLCRVTGQEPAAALTNVAQLYGVASQNPNTSHAVHLQGTVCWVNPEEGRLILQDGSGAVELELDWGSQAIQPRQKIRLEGNGTIAQRGAGFRIGVRGPVVDNNGVHPVVEKSGAVYLEAGWQPLCLDWFNGAAGYGLAVEYEGPGLPRQKIPESALFRWQVDAATGSSNRMHGLDYRCYEGTWEALPDFSRETVIKSGTVTDFDLRVVSREEHAALRFSGFIKIPGTGLYTFYTRSDDGSQLFVGEPALKLTVVGEAALPAPRRIAIGQTLGVGEDNQWSEVEGTVAFVSEQENGTELELRSGTGRMQVSVVDAAGLSVHLLLNSRIRATGICQGTYTADGQKTAGRLLVSSGKEISRIEPPFSREVVGSVNTNVGSLPLLTTAVEVHRLKREEAQRGYPVRVRGVITCVLPEHQAFTIEDSTRGVYVVDFSASRSAPPQLGEFFEVEGTTDPHLFAPIVNARSVRSLGAGHLPEPVRPTWDQLMNGSLDAQYVEIQGVMTESQPDGVKLLTRDGRIGLELRVNGLEPAAFAQYEDALVRVRGCLLASWDYVTHRVAAGRIRIYGADIAVDQPAPADLFSTPEKTAAELLLFDPQAGVFQRVKVSGQIVHVRDPEYFLMDGDSGLRFVLKKPIELVTGDLVEVVGFPELSGAAPVLREAVARRKGSQALPVAHLLRSDNLLHADADATRVQVAGLLLNVRRTRADQLLEMQTETQSGVRNFIARLSANDDAVQSLTIGSRLELTGTYAAQGGNRALGQDIASFELLLNSVADIKVLAKPPWWTLGRLLFIVGALACVLAITVLWITQLHRQVDERTAELGTQIRERQRVEHQREMEQERARVAQDLHDELGSSITEISMLAARANSSVASDEKRSGYLEQVGGKARAMVTALDEIVWAMNPRHDSLASLMSYFSLYADRFLGLANIAWRLEEPTGPPDHVVNSRHRHQLFLAFKEALTNIVRHSGATEVRLNVQVENGGVRLSIADNGRGLPTGARTEEMDGIGNMQERMERLGGRFEIASESGRGTVLKFYLPTN